jgi:predicted RNase H-like HicB family nuclease
MPPRKYVAVARSHKNQEYIRLTAIVEREGRKWVAVCQELGTAAQAASLDEALDRLKDAVELHLETLEDVGELHRFLHDQDIPVFKSRPRQRFKFTVGKMSAGAVASPMIQRLPGHSQQPERELMTV